MPRALRRVCRSSATRCRLRRVYKTPTLLNADFNAPYFHDGRYDTYDQVLAHFDRLFDLGLSAEDRADLVAYLTASGDALQPYDRDGVIPGSKRSWILRASWARRFRPMIPKSSRSSPTRSAASFAS